MTLRQVGVAVTLTLCIDAIAPRASAEPASPTEDRCFAAYENGQRLRKKHALRAARAEHLVCARDPCPKRFQAECVHWFDQVDALVPSVVVHPGAESVPIDTRVLVDGEVAAEKLDGKPIELDPGEHELRFEAPGHPPVERKLVVVEGDKLKAVTVTFGDTSPAPVAPIAPPLKAGPGPEPSSGSSASWVPWAFVGTAVVGLGSFSYFGLTGLAGRSDLDQCGIHCRQADIDATRRDFLVADISLGVSVVSLGIAAYLFFAGRHGTGSASWGNGIHVGVLPTNRTSRVDVGVEF